MFKHDLHLVPATASKPHIAGAGIGANGITPDESVLESKSLPLLSGYDSITGEPRTTCVAYNGTIDKFESKGAQAGPLEIDQSHSLEQFFSKQNLSASASIGVGGFKTDASYQLMHSRQLNQFSEYLRVSTSVNYPAYELDHDRIRWSTVGDRARKNPSGGWFYRQCGDSFIIGKLNGASFSAVYTSTSSSDEEQQESRSTLGAAYTSLTIGGQAAADEKTATDKLSASGRLQLYILRVGENEPYPSASPQDIIDYARNYSDHIAKDNLVWTISYVIRRYDEILTGVPETTARPGDDSAAEAEATYERKINERISNISFMIANPNQFGGEVGTFDPVEAQKEVDKLSSALDSRRENYLCNMRKTQCPSYEKESERSIGRSVPGRPVAFPVDLNNNAPLQIGSSVGDNVLAVYVTGRWNGCAGGMESGACNNWPANGPYSQFTFQSRKDFGLQKRIGTKLL